MNHLFKNKLISADTVGRNRRAFSSLRNFFNSNILSNKGHYLYIQSTSFEVIFTQRVFQNGTRHVAWPGWGFFNTSSTDVKFTGFDYLSHILHPRLSSCRNEGKLWDYCTYFLQPSSTPQWHLAEVFRQLWPNSELLLWPAYLTFDRWLQWTSSSMTLRLWKQCVQIFSAWGLWKASELPWPFLRQQMSDYSLKHTTGKLGQEGEEEENELSWSFIYKDKNPKQYR